MSRPTEIDLTVPGPTWRELPMPAANLPFSATRLAGVDGEFVLHGRFPAGFDRPVAGGYDVAEEFLVVDGELVVSGATYRRGELTYVPAGHVRTDMSSREGCTVLAWFGGPAIFRPVSELDGSHADGLLSVSVLDARGTLLSAGPVTWSTADAAAELQVGDVVEDGLRRWRHVVEATTAVEPAIVRTRG